MRWKLTRIPKRLHEIEERKRPADTDDGRQGSSAGKDAVDRGGAEEPTFDGQDTDDESAEQE